MAKALNVSLAVTADTSQAKAQLQQLQQTLQQLTSNSANLKLDINATEIQKASQAALELSAHLKTATNINTGTLDFTKLNNSIKSSGQTLEAYGASLLQLGPKGKQAFMELAQSVAKSEIPIKRLSGLLGNFGTVLSNTVRWQLSSSMIHGFMGAIQSAYRYAQDLNQSLNNIQIVTQMSDSQMASFAESANKAAKALSTTTTKYTDAALIYYQQGIRDQKAIAERTDATIKMANVTGQSAQEVSNQMTAIWNNFDNGAHSLEYYADVITALGAATASSSAEISQGLQKFAAIADTVGLSYENATAALATITATTRQSADTVGTGLRTVFSRLQSLSLGETLEDGVNLTKYSKAMKTIGVDILDASGGLRNMNDVLIDMGKTWQNLTDAQKTATAQTIGGVRQYTTIMALMENFDFYKQNVGVAQNAEGTLQQQQETYEKSWKAASQRVRASAESIYSALLNDQFFIKLNDNFSKILDFVNQFIKGMGGAKGVLLGLGSILQATFSTQIANNIYKAGVGVKSLFRNQADDRNNFLKNAAGMMAGGSVGADGKVTLTGAQTEQAQGFANYLKYQDAYKNSAWAMTPAQQTAAQMALDNYFQGINQQQKAQEKIETTGVATSYARSTMTTGVREAAIPGYVRANELVQKYNKGGALTKEERDFLQQEDIKKYYQGDLTQAARATKGSRKNPLVMEDMNKFMDVKAVYDNLKTTFNNYEQSESQHAKKMADLRAEEQSATSEDIKQQKKDAIALEEAQFDATTRAEAIKKFQDLGIDQKVIDDYVAKVKLGADATAEKAKIDEQVAQKQEAAQKLAEAKNRGVQVATGIQKVGQGITASLGAATSIEGISDTIHSFQDGTSTASDMVKSLAGGIGSLATQSMFAFSSMRSGVEAFAKALGKAGASAGWIGAVLTALTIAIPFIVKGFDNLIETASEKQERLQSYVELSQQDLQEAKQKYQDVFTDFKGHNALLDELNKLTEGTYAFKAALGEANVEASNLIEKYNLQENIDYYKDRQRAIHFASGIEDKVALQQEAEIAQKEYDLHLAEFVSDFYTNQKDINKELSSVITITDKLGTQIKLFEEKPWEQTNAEEQGIQTTQEGLAQWYFDLLEDKQKSSLVQTAQKYGWEDAVDFILDYYNNQTDVEKQITQFKGYTDSYRQVLEDRAKMDDGIIKDIEQLKINAQVDAFNLLDKSIDFSTKKIKLSNGNEIDLSSQKTDNNYYEKLKENFQQYLKDSLGETAGQDFYEDMLREFSTNGYTIERRIREINKYIAQQEQQKQLEQQMKEIDAAFEKVDTSKYDNYIQTKRKDLAAISSQAFKGYKQDQSGNWYSISDEESVSQELQDQLNAEKAMAELIAQQWGESAANLQEVLMAQTNLNITQDDLLNGIVENYSIEDLQTLSTYTNMFGQMFGKDTATYIFSELATEIKTGGTELVDALDSIDWTDSKIENLFSLKTAVDNLDVSKQPELKQKLTNTAALIYKELGGSAGLLEELYGSEGFTDTLENLKETFKETGKISAESILSSTKECKQLSKFLDITGVNAQGLADVLESIEIGDIGIDQVTDGLLEAMSAAGALEANLAQVYQHIDNFQLDRSISDVGKFYKGLADQVEDSQGAGMLFDSPLLQSWGELFGQNSLKTYKEWARMATDEKNWTPEQISNSFNEQFAAEIAAMQSIQERGNLSGMFEYAFNQAGQGAENGEKNKITDAAGNLKGYADSAGQIFDAAGEKLMHFNETTGQVVTDNDAVFQQMFAHQSDFIDYLANNLNIPRDMAEAMAAEFAATDSWAHDIWGAEAAKDGFDALLQSVNDGADLSLDALEAFYKKSAEFLNGETWEQFLKRFTEGLKDAKGSLIDLGKDFNYAEQDFRKLRDKMGDQEGETSLTEYLDKNAGKKAYIEAGSDGENSWGASTIESSTGSARDVNALQQAYIKLGYSASQANHIIAESLQAAADGNDSLGDGVTRLTGRYQTATEGIKEFATTDAEYLDWVEQRYGKAAAETAQYSAEYALAYQDAMNQQAQTEIDAKVYAEAFAEALTGIEVSFDGSGLDAVIAEAQIKAKEASVVIPVSWGNPGDFPDFAHPASGYNNAHGFAGGKHINGQYEGLAEAGELGEELWIHDGQPYLVGQKGRTRIYVHKNDEIYTASETRNILDNNPSLQDIPGFSVGYNKVTWGKKGTGVNADNAKTSKYEPERYHLITRQLKDLQREYDRLDKIKENCYGTNKLEAIQREIDAQNELIKGQKELIKEAEDYLKIDTDRLKGLLAKGEFQIDENGNLLNFEELQKKYRKAAEEDKDEHAQDIWKALNQYEETLDKLKEANVEMQDLLYQDMELRLEKITAKVDMRIDFDDREIKLLDHYIKRIDDNIYHTAEVLALTEQKLGHINQKINDTKQGITELFEEMSDSQGNKITKDDGTAYTLEEWLALTDKERDLLDINDNFGKQLEESMDNLLDYIEELEEFKTKGVEEFGQAFSELNDNIRSSIDLFDHYNQLLSSLKNITQLQGIKLSAEMKAAMKEIDVAMFNNTQNNIDAERENYRRLNADVIDLRKKIAETTDEVYKKQWEEQLKVAEEELRTSEQNLLSLWETGLQQAKDIFEAALQDAADEYETTIAGIYGTTDELQKAWDQQKKNNDFYVKDFEKYYQIQKLQRSITKDLDAAARAGNRQNQGLKKLYDDLNAARESGVELSSYDLDIFTKRYEYEKALMELEDARNAKSEVRLQRDANGNWGYVYTSSADEDDLIEKQQAVDDKFYELQKATQERIASLSDDMLSEITGVGRRLQELRSSGASQETIDKYLEQERKYLENYKNGLEKALIDAGMTEAEARSRYGDKGFDILDQFSETLLSAITGGNETLDEFFDRVGIAMDGTNKEMMIASQNYQGQMDEINKWFNESGEDLAKVIKGFSTVIDLESGESLIDSKKQIQDAKDTFDEILKVATQFEQKFISIYQPIIDENEKLVADLLMALHALNREEYEGPNRDNNVESIQDILNYQREDTTSNNNISSNDNGNSNNQGAGGGNGDYWGEWSDWKKEPAYMDPESNKLYRVRYLYDSKGNIKEIKTEEKTIQKKNVQNNEILKMDTGGYTGSWGPDGKIAMLHEKELVLNVEDTKNFLNATNILRTIDLQANLFGKGLGNIITPQLDDMRLQELEQDVHIEASFPNVVDHNEIEMAFDNLINKASQYANRKNMSSMTFQDMYTSKF